VISWHDDPPSPDEYVHLRKKAGLGTRSRNAAEIGLRRSLHCLTCRDDDELIAMGRVVGDGGCFVQLVDIAVAPTHQGRGLGSEMTDRLVRWCEASLPATCHISLVSSDRAVPLYRAWGFRDCRGLDRYADPTL